MSIEYRPIGEDEFLSFAEAASRAFGTTMSAQDLEAERHALEFDRTFAAFEDGRIVGTTATLSLDITLPGGRALPAGGLTWTAVLPTHRRRGLLRDMITAQLLGSAERGEPLSILQASESTIYGRFGYGTATYELGFSVATAHAGYRQDVGRVSGHGSFESLGAGEAAEILPALFQSLRLTIPGAVGRTAGLWRSYLADPEHEREGAGELFHLVHRDDDGIPDGYVSYRIKSDWDGGLPDGTLIVQELVARDPDTYAALWRFCLDMDLVSTVSTAKAPVDERLRWLLSDPRRLRVDRLNDGLWLRILDVPTALSARGYGRPRNGAGDALVLEVVDSFGQGAAGRYLLEVQPEGAACSHTSRPADLTLDVSELAAVYLGAVDFSSLVWARRIQESREGAAARADDLFRTERAPWCSTHF